MDNYTWHIGKPFFAWPFSRPKPARPVRDLIVLALLAVLLAFTFKREVKLIQQKGWQAWPEALADIRSEVTHPL